MVDPTRLREMMTGHRCIAFWSVLVMAVAGCDTPTEAHPSITGRVSLYDELGMQLPSADQTRVAALSHSSIRKYETLTDDSGRFELELPEEGFVPLLFSREGFGDMFRYGLEEETEPIQVRLYMSSSAVVTAVEAVAESCGTPTCLRLVLEVDDFFAPGTTRRVFRVYLSSDPNVSFFDYQLTELLFVPNDQPGLVRNGADATFELEGLLGLLGSFAKGDSVHMVIHGATENLTSDYEGPDSGLPIFTDISTVSSRAVFIIP